MPHVIVKLYPGRNQQQKQALADAVTKAVMETIGASEASVSVGIEDVTPGDWVARVWEPDIAAKPGQLFKKPGYDPT